MWQYISIVPKDPLHVPPVEAQAKAIEAVDAHFRKKGSCESDARDRVEFTCGLMDGMIIACPVCGHVLENIEDDSKLEWFIKALDEGFPLGFENAKTKMPCCKKTVKLLDIDFKQTAAFSKYSITIDNPEVKSLPDSLMRKVEKALGRPINQIRYYL